MKRGGPQHPKTYALAEALGIRRAHAVGILELLFHFTAQYCPAGDVGRFADKRLAAAMDWAGSPAKLVDAMVAAGWLDRHQTARLAVHDWAEHADRTVVQRMKRAGRIMIQPNEGDSGKVCTHVDTAGEQINALPEPEPEPEPEPHIRVSEHTHSTHPSWPLGGWESPEEFESWWTKLVSGHPNRNYNASARSKANELLICGKLNREKFERWYTTLRESNDRKWAAEKFQYTPNLLQILDNCEWNLTPIVVEKRSEYPDANEYIRRMQAE